MITGGTPVQKRIVLSIAAGGTVIGSIVLGRAACVPTTEPEVPPPVVVDATEEKEVHCDFEEVRVRAATRRVPRIVGGKPAQPGAFPFAAALATSGRFQYCGGSVVEDEWVLTAAHCQAEPGDLALVGSTDLTKTRAIRIVESRIHPLFNSQTLDWDVGVARLESSANVPTVPLATGVTTLDATVIGWGATSEGGSATQHLQEVSVPLWEAAKCRSVYPALTERQVCAGRVEGGADSCQGDSGGSLLTWNVDHWEQLGIVSYGIGCARPGVPGVYTDIRAQKIREWVEVCTK